MMTSLMQVPWLSALAWTLIHFLWQGAVVWALVVCAASVLRSRSAAARYRLYGAAMVVLALCPILSFAYLARDAKPTTIETASVPQASIPQPTIAPAETIEVAQDEMAPIESVPNSDPIETEATQVTLETSAAIPERAPEPTQSPSGQERFRIEPYLPYILFAYLIGVALMFTRFAVALRGGTRLRRSSEPIADTPVLEILARQAKALGLAFTPAIAYSRRVVVPTVVGVLKPVILLPIAMQTGVAPQHLEHLLSHELAHLRRYDHLVNVLQGIVECLLFFHPAVWALSRKLRVEREHCCDDLVLQIGGEPNAYAQTLVHIAELSRAAHSSPATLAAGRKPSELRRRIVRLLGGPEPRMRLTPWGMTGISIAAIACAVTAIAIAAARERNAHDDEIREAANAAEVFDTDWPGLAGGTMQLAQAVGEAEDRISQNREARELVDQLSESDIWLRRMAIKQMGDSANKQFVPHLLSILTESLGPGGLSDEEEKVLEETIIALGKLGDAAATKYLVAALRKFSLAEGSFELQIAEALAAINDPRSIAYLQMVLDDPNAENARMRAGAYVALGELATPESYALLIQHSLHDRDEFVSGFLPSIYERLDWETLEPKVLAALSDGDPYAIANALRILSRKRYAFESNDMLEWTAAENEIVRNAALDALATSTNLQLLVDMNASENRAAKKSAIEAMAKLDDPHIPSLLTEYLQAEDFETIQAAARALENLGHLPEDPALAAAYHIGVENMDVAARYGDNVVQPLRAYFEYRAEDPIPNWRGGGAAMRNRDVFFAAIETARQLKREELVAPLTRFLSGHLQEFRRVAAFTLGEMQFKSATPAIVDALVDRDADVRTAAAGALKLIADPAAVPALEGSLRDTSNKVREETVRALAAIDTPEAYTAMLVALKDNDIDILRAAANAFGQAAFGPALEGLIALLEHQEYRVRAAAAEALGKIGDARAVAALGGRLQDTHRVAEPAAQALGAIGDASAVPYLRDALRNAGGSVVFAMVNALRQIGGPAAIDALTDVFWHSDRPVTKEGYTQDEKLSIIATTLESLGVDVWTNVPDDVELTSADAPMGDEVETIADSEPTSAAGLSTATVAQLHDKDWWIRKVATERLADMPAEAVAPLLIAALKDEDPRVIAAAANVLATKRDPSAILHLVAVLKEKEPARTAAAEALAAYDSNLVLEPLGLALQDDALLSGAVYALERIDTEEIVLLLLNALKRMNAVRNPAATSRTTAMDILASKDADTVVPPLIAMIDPAAPQSFGMVQLLGRFADDQRAQETLYALASNAGASVDVRAAAMGVLREDAGAAAKSLFVSLLEDRNFWIRAEAGAALEAANYQPETPRLRALYRIPRGEYSEIRAIGADAVEPLIEVFDLTWTSSDLPPDSGQAVTRVASRPTRPGRPRNASLYDAHGEAIISLGAIGDPRAIPVLTEIAMGERLQEYGNRGSFRQDAIGALARIDDPKALDAIIAALESADSRVAYAAAERLGERGDLRAVEPLCAVIHRPEIQVAVTQALANLGDARAIESLRSVADSVSDTVRGNVLRGLIEIGGEAVMEDIVRFVDDPDSDVAAAAIKALGELEYRSALMTLGAVLVPTDPGARPRSSREKLTATVALANMMPESIPYLVQMLPASTESSVLSRAEGALRGANSELVVQALVAHFEGADSESEQRLALSAMANYPDARLAPLLSRIIGDAAYPESVRIAAAEVVSKMSFEEALPAIESLIGVMESKSRHWALYEAAFTALMKVPPTAAAAGERKNELEIRFWAAIKSWKERWREVAPRKTWDLIDEFRQE